MTSTGDPLDESAVPGVRPLESAAERYVGDGHLELAQATENRSVLADSGIPDASVDAGGSLGWLQLLLIFVLVGLVGVTPALLQNVADQQPVPWERLASELVGWCLWALFVPLALAMVRRYPLERRHWRRRIWIHLVTGVMVSIAYAVLEMSKSWLLLSLTTETPPRFWRLGRGYLLGGLEFYLLVYSAILAVVHAFEYHRRFRDRELRASQLEAGLSQARVQVLRSQLNPHFLFNTLNAISALMYRDVDAADRMLVTLSDFLRMSLDQGGEQVIALSDEIELLEKYIEIEKARFADRLEVRLEIDPEVEQALVPSLVLQPLVENSIRHGISRRSAAGLIEVQARPQFPDRIELRVWDSGPGMKGNPVESLKPGVGLHNTEARLRQLYGDRQSFVMRNGRDGGFQVELAFPLRFENEAQAPGDG